MKFRIKNLLFFQLIFIVNGKPFNQADYPSFNNRILKDNYVGFVNSIQHVDNNANIPSVRYGNIMNNEDYSSIKYANLDANKGGYNAVQDAGSMQDNRWSLGRRNQILEPSETTLYDINELYTPLVSIYGSYPVDIHQQQQIIHDIEEHLFKPEQSRLLDALISIESVPFPNPLIFLSQPSPFQQHSVNIPTQNLRRFSFQMSAFPSFQQSFSPSFGNSFGMFPLTGGYPSFPRSGGFPPFPQNGGFPSFPQNGGFPSFPSLDEFKFPDMDNIVFPDMNGFFKEKFDSKKFEPAIVQDSMKDKNGNTPDLIQIGKNNKNIKSSTQHGIVQISRNMRRTEQPIITTTEFPDETTTLLDETTTMFDEAIDRIDENLKESLVGK